MRKSLIALIAVLAAWLLSGCYFEDHVPRFMVAKNNSSDTLVWFYGHSFIWPDTLLQERLYKHDYYYMKVAPGDRVIGCMPSQIEFDAYMRSFKYDIQIFVSLDTIKKYGWEDVVKNDRVYQRYYFSYKDYVTRRKLKNNHEVYLRMDVEVPPSAYMKDVKMWPPYGHYPEYSFWKEVD